MNRHWLIEDQFFSHATSMRRHFDRQFSDPARVHSSRFVWDYWHMPEQYTHLRTPAFHYFPPTLYRRWHEQLVNWGRDVLGCHDISPPWLSCYVDGCSQEIHADHPHGPWAFVFSLTNWSRKDFRGGETFLLKPKLLSEWSRPTQQRAESLEMTERIAPKFNRLTVFDPRLPHGVRRVSGTQDPREGRLVIHGWFVQPRPFFKGPLSVGKVEEILTEGLADLSTEVSGSGVNGYVSLRLKVSSSGRVGPVVWLTNTLVGADAGLVKRHLEESIRVWKFPRAKRGSVLTLPVRFGL